MRGNSDLDNLGLGYAGIRIYAWKPEGNQRKWDFGSRSSWVYGLGLGCMGTGFRVQVLKE